MKFILDHKLTFIGIFLGAIGGFLYCHYVGCASGTCPITSKQLIRDSGTAGVPFFKRGHTRCAQRQENQARRARFRRLGTRLAGVDRGAGGVICEAEQRN